MERSGALKLTVLGWAVALPVLFLSAVGLAAIHATDRPDPATNLAPGAPLEAPSDANWLSVAYRTIGEATLRQAAFLATGVALMLLVLVPSYRRIGGYAFPIYFAVIVLLALLVLDKYIDLPLIPVKRNTRRWVQIGQFQIQPSEFIKPALILALAYYLRFRNSYRTWIGLIPPFLLTLLPMFLILKEPDLGTVLMLLPVLFAMLFVAGARLRHLATIIVLGLAFLPLFYFFGMEDYQKKRIDVLFKQSSTDERWHQDAGYQLRQSKVALGSGGLLGQGYGEGDFVRSELLPEEHNDFIFAIIG
ncbi:MAG: FtsW/RodA/SpoVE family cell cycle protein, partial [Rhizobiales bacterium]|nr:FtsW/RodA/SpoVE family cell cycle protein [Hyphomicrobiales bacterium]